MLRLISLLSILFFIPVNAMAAKINDEGAQKLKDSFQGLLDYQKSINETFGSVRIIYEGELEVKQEKEYYAVTFPHIFIKNPEFEVETGEDITLDLGVITLNTMPDEKDGYWKVVLVLPNKLTLSDNSTDDILSIGFKEQSTIAIFNDALGYFTKIDMNLSDISIKEGEDELDFKLDGVQIYTNLDEGENGKFSGPGYVSLKGLNITSPEKESNANLGELKFDFSMSDVKLPSLEEYHDKVIKHAETFQSLNTLEQSDTPQTIDNQSVINMISDLYDFEMDGFNFQYSIRDLEVRHDPDNNSRNFETFKLGLAFLSLGFDGLSAEKGMFNIKTGYDNIKITPNNPEYNDLLPQNINFDIRAENIPYKTLYELSQNSITSIAENPDMASMVGIGLLMRLPAILSQSDTKIIVEKNGIKNDNYALKLDGEIVTDLAAMMSFAAKFKAVFNGLDKLLSISDAHATNTESENADNFANLSKTLETMKNVGKTDAGKDSYIFEFETTPQGQLLINGQDITTIAFQ